MFFNRAEILFQERLNAMQPQKKYYDEDYGELVSAGPREVVKRNEAINRIISRLRPTYSKRPRERYVPCPMFMIFLFIRRFILSS